MHEARPSSRRLLDALLLASKRAALVGVVGCALFGAARLRHTIAGANPLAPELAEVATADSTAAPAAVATSPRAPADWRIPAIAAVLRERTRGDSAVSERAALGIVREADRLKLNPALLVGVLLVENTTLKPSARNRSSGATGLMQVMPFHAGKLGCESRDLTDVDANICHGARILADVMQEQHGDMNGALLRYNGCVRGTVTPDCHRYPSLVIDRAINAANQILAQLPADARPRLARRPPARRTPAAPRRGRATDTQRATAGE